MAVQILSAKSFIGMLAHYVSGDLASAGANLLIISVILHRLPAEVFGHYAIAQAITAVLISVVMAAMTLVATPRIAAHPECTWKLIQSVLRVRFVLVGAATLAMVLMAILRPGQLGSTLLASIPVIMLQGLNLDFALVGLGRARWLAASRLLTGGTFLTLAIVCIGPETPAWQIPILGTAGLTMGLFVQILGLRLLPDQHASIIPTKGLWRNLTPPTAAHLAQMASYNLDVIVLGMFASIPASSIGDYGAVSKLMQFGTMPLVAVLFAGGPGLAQAAAKRDPAAFASSERHLRLGFRCIGLVGGILLAGLGPWALEHLSGRAMPAAWTVAPWFGLGYALIGFHSGWTATLPFIGDHSGYLWVNLIAIATVMLGLSLLVPLLPTLGLHGAAIAVVSGLVALAIAGRCRYRKSRLAIFPPTP